MKVAKKHILGLCILSFWAFTQLFLLTPSFVQAANLWDQQQGFKNNGDIGSEAFGVTSPGDNKNDVRIIIAKVLKVFLGVLGIIFVILIILAGFKYMNARGNDDKVKEALDQIQQSVIGLLIIMAAFGIAVFVETQIRAATTDVVW